MGKKHSFRNQPASVRPPVVRKYGRSLVSRNSPAFQPWLFLLLPVAIALILSLFLRSSGGAFLLWLSVLFLFGAAAFPLTSLVFSAFTTRGYGFSKVIGILCVAFTMWTAAYLRLLPFRQPVVLFLLLGLAGLSWGIPKTRKAAIAALTEPGGLRGFAFQESLFVIALFAWCVIKGSNPAINGEEKFMDFAFLNALVRTDTLPSPDPWMAGRSINYYYFGQYIYAMLSKVSGIRTGITYTLSMCSCFAFSFTMAYSLGSMFFEGARLRGLSCPRFFRIGAGFLSALCVTLFGNSHAFFYYENSPGNRLLPLFQSWGAAIERTDNFFYPDSTRFIGYNPRTEILDASNSVLRAGDMTIHEFPCYSFLLGDLHAHLISMMVVMTIIAVLFAMFFRNKGETADSKMFPPALVLEKGYSFFRHIREEARLLIRPEMIAVGVLLAIAMMCNYWDFLIYFVFASMVMLIDYAKNSRRFASIPGTAFFMAQVALILLCYLKFAQQPFTHATLQFVILLLSVMGTALFPCALTRTGLGMSFLFTVSGLGALPFNANFDMIANAIARTVNQTPIYQFLILWGTHLLFTLAILVITVLSAFGIASNAAVIPADGKPNPIRRFLLRLNPSDLFMSGVGVVGLLLLAAPEIFYVMDIYGGSYKRANTMFKFTFAAFILLSLVIGYTVFRLFSLRSAGIGGNVVILSLAIFLSATVAIPAVYPTVAIDQRTGPITLDENFTLDGTSALKDHDSPQLAGYMGDMRDYASAIEWLNQNITGSPVICEAYGPSYTDYCVVSAYTGLPTVIGWQTHEWLWHFQGIVNSKGELVNNPQKPDVWSDILTPRDNDVNTVYTSADSTEILSVLGKYNVKYLIVGELERTQYPYIDDALMKSLGNVVFSSSSVYIVEIGDTAVPAGS